MSIHLYQIQYDEKSRPCESSGFIAFDVRDNPEFLKREMAHWLRFYEEVISQDQDKGSVYGLFSPKFFEKTRLDKTDVFEFFEKNKGVDVFLFNPYPMNTYLYMNVWQQCDVYHGNVSILANQLLIDAGYNYHILDGQRHSKQHVVYCNYWMATREFCDAYYLFIRKLDGTIESMPDIKKNKFFEKTAYRTTAVCYPFVFERMISTFLYENNSSFKVASYDFNRNQVAKLRLGRVGTVFYNKYRDKFDGWEQQPENKKNIADAIKKIDMLCHPRFAVSIFSKLLRSIVRIYNVLRMKSKLRFLHE